MTSRGKLLDVVPRLSFQTLVSATDRCHFQRSWLVSRPDPAIHDHDFFELFWIDSGRLQHLINEQRLLMQPGSLAFIRPEDRHGFEIPEGETCVLINVAFGTRIWTELSRRYALDALFSGAEPERHLTLGRAELGELGVAAAELLAGARDRFALDRFLLNAVHLVRRARQRGHPAGTPKWLIDACNAIKTPRHFQRGTTALVKLAGHSAEHVARETRRWLGKTPTDIVNEARLEHAAARLSESDEPIVELALDCGYENASHFYRLFKGRYGESPGQYRERQQRIVLPK